MALPCPLEKMDKAQPPPPCKIAGQPEEQALAAGKGFIQNVYAAMDGGAHGSIPFRQNSCVAFKQGAADRYEGQSLLPRLQQLHKGQTRDLSGLTVQIFPGNSLLALNAGDMVTEKSAPLGLRHRTADFFFIATDAEGQHLRSAIFHEIDEDCGPALPGAVQNPQVQQGDQLAAQFVPYFYKNLDDGSQRGNLNALFRDPSCLTVGNDLFKGAQHIAHKVHYLPPLVNAAARKVEGQQVIPSPAGGFFVFTHGIMQLGGEERQQRFVDLFHLLPEGGSFWVSNLIMKVHGGV